MKKTVLTIIAAILCLGAALLSAQGADAARGTRKKVIELGWDIPTTQYLREHWREMEENAPFNGVIYDLAAKSPSGAAESSQALFTPDRWRNEDFASCVDDLKSCAFRKYTDNFIRINFYPAEFAWDDDDAWSAVSEKAGICAEVARETGGGLCFDFESYGAAMFRWKPDATPRFADAKALARRRGAQFARTIVEKYPNVVVLCLWMNSINYRAGGLPNPDAALRGSDYGLLPSFIDGLLDAACPETRFVEGCENGYVLNGVEEYQRASLDALLSSGPGVALVSPENREKYRAQVGSGFGFYLDMYTNPESSPWHRGAEPGETRFERLQLNLRAAVESADEYVWVYGEQRRWWAPDAGKEWRSWEEALPGLTEFISGLADPEGALASLRDRFRTSPELNLLQNGAFETLTDAGGFAGWSSWRHEESKGEFVAEKGRAAIKGDRNACWLQSVPAVPGERLFISGRIGATGDASGHFRARWQDESGKWTAEPLDVVITPSADAPDDGHGAETLGSVVVPQSARRLVLLLGASCPSANDAVFFEDVGVFRVDGERKD